MNAGLIALILSISPHMYEAPERRPEYNEQKNTTEDRAEKSEEESIKKAKQGLHKRRDRKQMQEWLEDKAQEMYQEAKRARIIINFFSWQERVYRQQIRNRPDLDIQEMIEGEIKEIQKVIKREKQYLKTACNNLREIPPRYRKGPLPEECKEYLEETLK